MSKSVQIAVRVDEDLVELAKEVRRLAYEAYPGGDPSFATMSMVYRGAMFRGLKLDERDLRWILANRRQPMRDRKKTKKRGKGC